MFFMHGLFIQIGRRFLWNENNVYISLDEYREMHWTISINNMQKVKWIDQDLQTQKQGNIMQGIWCL